MNKSRGKLILLIVAGAPLCYSALPSTSAATDYSTIRVRLTMSPSKPASVSITLSEAYKVKEKPSLTLPKGSYTVSSVSSGIRVRGQGVDQVFTSATTLQPTKESALMTVSKTTHGNIKYLGDMRFAKSSSSLTLTNYVALEKYLYGVVAYEMSNAFPIEALKAQAVSARSYAIKSFNPSRSYDIGDTASDQVYKGFNSSYKRVINAVDGTKGEVATYNGKIISTYYSASNGGQTEYPGNTWGGGDAKNKAYPYLTQKDDPYDLRNKYSIMQKIFVPKDVENSSDGISDSGIDADYVVRVVNVNEWANVRRDTSTTSEIVGRAPLNSMYKWIDTKGDWFQIEFEGDPAYIHNSVSQKVKNGSFAYKNPVLTDLQNSAYQVLKDSKSIENATDIKIVSVDEFKNGKERWPGTGSRNYVTAKGTLTVQYYSTKSDKISSSESVNVEMKLMNTSSSGSYLMGHDYLNSILRMRGVETTDGGYNVTNARYGHGVGMSQRGAQQMANEGKSYREIMAFYFDGTKITKMNTDDSSTDLPDRDDGEDTSTPALKVTSSTLNIGSNTITKVDEQTSVAKFMDAIKVENGKAELTDHSGKAKTSGTIATGDVVRIKDNKGSVKQTHNVIIYGDVSGDGAINIFDIAAIRRDILGVKSLSGVYKSAADLNSDSNINIFDIAAVRRHILGVKAIEQK
ncbi:MAG TPA: hypothetical protein DHN33_04140 [Eubacteriaceae bacterium]|nr:hypothetical protein [Eubacteriaceae bacterium]